MLWVCNKPNKVMQSPARAAFMDRMQAELDNLGAEFGGLGVVLKRATKAIEDRGNQAAALVDALPLDATDEQVRAVEAQVVAMLSPIRRSIDLAASIIDPFMEPAPERPAEGR